MRPENERRRNIVTSPLIGWALTQKDPWDDNVIRILPFARQFENMTHLITSDKQIKVATTMLKLDNWWLPVTTSGVVDTVLSKASFHCTFDSIVWFISPQQSLTKSGPSMCVIVCLADGSNCRFQPQPFRKLILRCTLMSASLNRNRIQRRIWENKKKIFEK